MNKTTIFWFRRDLRVEDNHALFLALQNKNVKPIFIFDTSILDELDRNDPRVTFIYQSLKKIDKICRSYGSSLQIYYGNSLEVWSKIISTHTIEKVYANEDYEPYGISRDEKIKNLFKKHGNITLCLVKDHVIFAKNEIVKKDGLPYTVYTPYKKKWVEKFDKNKLPRYNSMDSLENLLKFNIEFPTIESINFKLSNIEVKEINYARLNQYDELRDFPALDATSNVSVHLRFGTISIRTLVKKALDTNEVWLSELIWREFFMQILYHYPIVVTNSFKQKYDAIIWRNNLNEFEKWCNGETGYYLVDAGMRQLNKTGYMHNRVRMVCASFLCKHLLIDWRLGEAYFAKKLLDFDLASNNGNWQWVAGTGCDSAPYFRIFNPITQQKKFDKDLQYCRKWIKDIDELTYAKPIVEHTFARERCLNHYKKYLTV